MNNKHNIESLTEQIIKVVTNGESPLEKWLDLEEKNIVELYTFHLVYCWYFIQDNKLIEMNGDNAKHYFTYSFIRLKKILPELNVENYYGIYIDRYKNFGAELKEIRKNNLTSFPHFPNYFYSHVCQYPMQINVVLIENFEHEDWPEDQLSDMFSHQINHLEANLKQLL